MNKLCVLYACVTSLLSVCNSFAHDDWLPYTTLSSYSSSTKYSHTCQPTFFADNYHPCAPCPTDYNPRRYTTETSSNYNQFSQYQRQPGTTHYVLDLLGDYNQCPHDAAALKALIARQDEALSRYDLYKNEHFRQQIKQLPHYKQTIKRLYALHKNTKLPRLQAFLGDYDMSLRAIIFTLDNEIEAEEKEQKKGHSDKAREQRYQKKQEEAQKRATYHTLKTAHAQQKIQAQTLLHTYEQHTVTTIPTHSEQLIRSYA